MLIQTADFLTSMASYDEPRLPDLPQIAVVGKSNVGKSTLINMLCQRRKLCKTSSTPGKTRLINVFTINDSFHLVDLPGYGFAKVDKAEQARWGEMMEAYFHTSTRLKHVLHLVDIRHDPTRDDLTMSQALRTLNISYTVVATKADKISRGARQKQLAPICRGTLKQPWEIICCSGEDGTGRDALLAAIEAALMQEPTPPIAKSESAVL